MTISFKRQTKRSLWLVAATGLALAGLFGGRHLIPDSGKSDDSLSSAPPSKPSEWHWLQRTYPFYTADRDAVRLALDARDSMLRSRKIDVDQWTFLGPTNIGGRVVDIEFNPKDGSEVYLAAATGGVFKSIDGADTWFPVFDEHAILTIGDIAVDPIHPDTLFVGTGEANGGHNNFAGGGVYKSVDGGQSWQYSGLEETVSIGRIVVDPSNSDRVFVAAVGSYFETHPDRGVFRSTDGGETWSNVLFVSDSTGAIDVAINPRNPDTLFAATWERVRRPNGSVDLYGAGSAVHRSTDGGNTWTQLGPLNGLPDPATVLDNAGRPRIGRIGLAISPSDPSNVYALFTDGFRFMGVFRSQDGGDSWQQLNADINLSTAFSDFSWYFGQIRVSPADPEKIFALDYGIAQTGDGGDTWQFAAGTHVDHHAMAFHPDDDTIILDGNDGGLSRSTDGGASWSRINGLPITQFYEINYDPFNPDNVLGGSQDNGTLRSFGTSTSNWYQISGGDGFYVFVDPNDPNTVYSSSQNGQLYRSGQSIVGPLDYKSNWSTPVVVNPENTRVLYYGSDRLLRSSNRGLTWSAVSGNLTSHTFADRLGTITSIAIAPSDTSVIYVGTDDGNVWVTTDRANTWSQIADGLPQRWVTRIAVNATDPATAFITFSGLKWRDPQPHVYRTLDFGETWRNISGNLPDAPANALALDPLNPDQLFVGTDVGAFYTEDGGTQWQVLGQGLPAVPVYDLKYVEGDRILLAGTHGRSMYSIPVPNTPTSTEPGADQRQTATGRSYPNPFVGHVTIEFDAAAVAEGNVVIRDILGRVVRRIYLTGNASTNVSVLWDGRDSAGQRASAGLYFAVLVTAGDRVGDPRSTVAIVRSK